MSHKRKKERKTKEKAAEMQVRIRKALQVVLGTGPQQTKKERL